MLVTKFIFISVLDKGSGQSTGNMAQGQEVKTNKDVVQLKKVCLFSCLSVLVLAEITVMK